MMFIHGAFPWRFSVLSTPPLAPAPTLLSYQSKAQIRKEPEIFDSAAWYIVQMVKNLPAMQETQVSPLCCVDPLEEEMATHSSILAWRIPWTEEPAGFPSMGSQKVEHDWVSNTHIYIFLCQWVISHMVSRELYICKFLPPYFTRHLQASKNQEPYDC